MLERFAKRVEGRFHITGAVPAFGGLPQRIECALILPYREVKIGTNEVAEEEWIRMEVAGHG